MERGILQVVRSDRVTNVEAKRITFVSDLVAVGQTLGWIWGGHVARKDQRRWGLNNRRQENTALEDPIGRHVQKSSGRVMITNSQNWCEWSEFTPLSTKVPSLGVPQRVIKPPSSLWLRQEAIALMELIRLIYLFTKNRKLYIYQTVIRNILVLGQKYGKFLPEK